MKGYWWQNAGGRYFADSLTPYLYWLLTANDELMFEPRVRDADFVALGSVLHDVPTYFSGTILGTGAMNSVKHPLPDADLMALRGRLTQEVVGRRPKTLGDPAIVLPFFFSEFRGGNGEVWIPHPRDRRRFGPKQINPITHPENLINEMLKYDRVSSSSLYAIIIADAFGLEHRWLPSDQVLGNGFEFRDYVSAFKSTIEEGAWRLTERTIMKERQEAMLDVIQLVFS
jgi:pyruvyltransferase